MLLGLDDRREQAGRGSPVQEEPKEREEAHVERLLEDSREGVLGQDLLPLEEEAKQRELILGEAKIGHGKAEGPRAVVEEVADQPLVHSLEGGQHHVCREWAALGDEEIDPVPSKPRSFPQVPIEVGAGQGFGQGEALLEPGEDGRAARGVGGRVSLR